MGVAGSYFGKFVDVADGAVMVGIDYLTRGKDFFDEFFKVLAVFRADKIIRICQLRFFKKVWGWAAPAQPFKNLATISYSFMGILL